MAHTLQRFTVGPLQENCYLLADDDSRRAVLIDPGDEAKRLLSALDDNDYRLGAVWLTHAHFDHVGALADILATHDVPFFMHQDDELNLARAAEAASAWGLSIKQPPTNYQPLTGGQVLDFAGLQARCLFTPGHAPGHLAFYFEDAGMVIAGDALFRGSIGRTDLPGGNHAQLLESVKLQLLTLPDDTVVYPGHGPETNIGFEANNNPFLS